MKLSSKGRYGLKAMFELALNNGNDPVPLNFIAKKQGISEQYLEQIFSNLRKSGLITSVRGTQGGYLLSKSASGITVGNILEALEGPVTLSACVSDDDICDNSETCVTKNVWTKIKNGMEEVLHSITLQNMIDDYYLANNKNDYINIIRDKRL